MIQASGGGMGSLFERISLHVIIKPLSNFFNKEKGRHDIQTILYKRKRIINIIVKVFWFLYIVSG